ncbi:MAG: N-acetylgalactosamine-4-sulfatase [Caldilineae bacterium]|nr:MAG: N-acetylgalactosamine-4-sulfatase [Caldilineae bacterium]
MPGGLTMRPHPNVILVLTDDQGYGDLACHGNPVLRTPNLDRMYAESVRLRDYHVGPTCAPTRAGLLTGHYANSTGVWHTIGGRSLLRKDEISMADFFARAGYATGIFGKWHLGDNYPYRPQDRGFQEVVVHGGGGVGQTPDYWGNKYFDDAYWTGDRYTRFPGYCTDVWFRTALDFIHRHREEPFFCYLPTNAPHSPHLVDPRYSDPYLAVTPHAERAKYYGMIANIDENFGLLRQRLEEWGLAENTILIFMTDNGSGGGVEVDENHFVVSGFNAGMRGKKNSEYDGGHRTPCFIHWPAGGLTGGRDVTQVTANVDILPTLLDLCGVDDPAQYDFDGDSLAPLLRGENVDWPDRVLVTDSQRLVYPVKWRKSAVMTNRWRLVNGRELYDIQADPGQREDIAAAHPDVVARLRTAYEAWWEKVSRQFDEEIPITLGDETAGVVRLNAHDWRNEACECPWNQNQVREGLIANGYWEVEVAAAGRYRFELRRWPQEEDRPLVAGIPGRPVPFHEMTIESGYGGGRAIPVCRARLIIGEQEVSAPVDAAQESVVFHLDLPAGPTHLQTWFETEDGEGDLGAYYVYVARC